MAIELFTVTGHEWKESHLGLLPGIPQSLLQKEQVGRLEQGSELLLELPNGDRIETELFHYYIRVQGIISDRSELEKLPIVVVLPAEIKQEQVPVGTKVILKSEEILPSELS